jgi:hypothetical protein
MRRCVFMGKLNPEKFSQRLQDLNKYLDLIPIERTRMAYKTQKADGKSLPDDEIRSNMGQACVIPQVRPAHKYPIPPLGDDSYPWVR